MAHAHPLSRDEQPPLATTPPGRTFPSRFDKPLNTLRRVEMRLDARWAWVSCDCSARADRPGRLQQADQMKAPPPCGIAQPPL